eukprot:TRINITY_DN114591_c0_g1_i1.p1 TRINITY_DN114591_c0_g1~~TRINITY_DN114591_c0_g1_i1.p1  ORF type:complete len:467 (-),score=134.91 TRINITY_DN114591_c0_g1_i1:42-1442(-)
MLSIAAPLGPAFIGADSAAPRPALKAGVALRRHHHGSRGVVTSAGAPEETSSFSRQAGLQLVVGCAAALPAGRAALRRRHRPVRQHHVVRLAEAEAAPPPAAEKTQQEIGAAGRSKFVADGSAPAVSSSGRRQRVLSGVQPTGDLHLGNYFGAINQWVGMQEDYDCFFCIVDLHAITVPHNPKELRKSVLSTAAAYLASGITPEKSTIFVQSAVPQHAQLAWLLNTQTPMSWLNAMTQYKEKAVKQQQGVCAGLFGYPVLMAADILLYQADKVPVGEDQMEHLFLARDIAQRMNKTYKKTAYKKRNLFREPEPLIRKTGARVMSLQDGTSKMSKSAPNPDSRICITDDAATIKRKVKRCKTDSVMGMELGNPERPEATSLLSLYSLVRGCTPEEAAAECAEDNWGVFKGKLTEALVEYLTPLQGEYHRILDDQAYLRSTLEKGRSQAVEVAAQTLGNVETAMGFGF